MPREAVTAPCTDVPLCVEVTDGLGGVSAGDWGWLFGDHPDSYQSVAFSQRCGMDGFVFRTIVVSHGGAPLLVVPTFESVFRASSMAEGVSRRLMRVLEPVMPGLLLPRLFGIGLVECEWCAVGIREGAPDELIERAWREAASRIDALARAAGANAIVLLELGPGTMGRVPADLIRGFAPVRTSPCARVPLPFDTVDQYLKSLSRSTRQSLRRRARPRADLRVERTIEPGAHLPRIIELYRRTVARAPVSLGVQRPVYFERVCEEVPGAHYVLYLSGDRLIGFNLLVSRDDTLIDKYFCMEPEEGRGHHLYFYSWMENIRCAIESGCSVYHAGPGSVETKSHLGCRFIQTTTLFRHTSAGAHAVLSFLARTVAREPVVSGGAGQQGRAGAVGGAA